MRIAVIDYDLCDPQKCGFLCQKVCPINLQGKECIKRDMIPISGTVKEMPVINEELCIGCGICVKKCPVDAIKIVNTPDRLEEEPVHRYGKNGFVLFRLPIPRSGVVGILGENGLGKSTALKILAGELKPNLGKEEADWQDIIRLHRGNEIQPYLEKLSEGGIHAIYKPQSLDAIKRIMGSREIGSIVSDDVLSDYGILHLKDRKISQLSGGELQKFLIALAMSKKADIYLIDEPTSYLDVYQRVEVARKIKSAPAPVIVIDHDIASLDFMADYIHIFYGEPSAFGVVSKPYSVRNGINAFIEGYIREDNVRIHEKIKFVSSAEQKGKGKVISEIPEMEKTLGSFHLSVAGHEIRKDEIVGILGRNGLGKSTYMRLLAGEIKPDNGQSQNLNISYKKQFIEPEDATAESYIGPFDQNFKISVISPLGIERLLGKNLFDLSGGELQRVVIAKTLNASADMYLLDEPCAFLDVRQRLALAKVLRNFSTGRSIMVVDHDLLFLSYVSDRLVVFSGTPGIDGRADWFGVRDGMNYFLRGIGLTFRKDPETGRPRANKEGSKKDNEQKSSGNYYEA